MLKIRSDDIVAICGKRRSGKTYFTKWLLRRIPKWIVWDYNFEYKMGDVIVYTLTDLRIQYRQGVKRIVYRPMSKTDEDFEAFCAEAFSYANVMIVVEEVERYATSWQIPFSLKRIVDVGRHRGLGLIATMRRTKRVHADILFNADHIIAFHQHRPQDLDYLAEYIGEIAYRLKTLPDFWFLWYADREGKTYICRRVE